MTENSRELQENEKNTKRQRSPLSVMFHRQKDRISLFMILNLVLLPSV